MHQVPISDFLNVGLRPIYGFDLSSRKIALVCYSDEVVAASTCLVKKSDRPSELSELMDWAERVYGTLPTGYTYIVEPVVGRGGARPTVLQAQVDGLLQALSVRFGHKAYSVNNKTWKKAVVGNGNASKEAVKSWLASYQPVLSQLAGDDQDLADAACAALYGSQIIEASSRRFPRSIRVDT